MNTRFFIRLKFAAWMTALLLLASCMATTTSPGITAQRGHIRVLQWRDEVEVVAWRYDQETAFLLGLILAESGGDPRAISSADCRGLTQIGLPLASDYYPNILPVQLFDPNFNLNLCGRHLSRIRERLRHRYPRLTYEAELRLLAAAWHSGWGNVTRAGGVPRIPATELFVERVMRYRNDFINLMMEY